MNPYYLAFVVPVLFLIVGLEWWWAEKKNRKVFRFNDSVVNISCGIIERSFNLLYYIAMYFVFEYLYRQFGIFEIGTEWWPNWLLALIAMDFLYYWIHRWSHELNFLWASHVTHHSSEEYNLTVSFRNSFVPLFVKTVVWGILPIVGFDPRLMIFGIAFNGLYQFFLHTRLVGKLGILEKILVTPSSHRVHHGCNEQYLDKNYGAVFIIWDRMLGTFQKEEEPVRYGITKPLHSQNPIWAYVHYWVELVQVTLQVKGWKDKFSLWFENPSKTAKRGINIKEYQIGGLKGKNIPKTISRYVFCQIAIHVALIFVLTFYREYLGWYDKIAMISLLSIGAISSSTMLTLARWPLKVESVRLLFLSVIPLFMIPEYPWACVGFFLLQLAGICWLAYIKHVYYPDIASDLFKKLFFNFLNK